MNDERIRKQRKGKRKFGKQRDIYYASSNYLIKEDGSKLLKLSDLFKKDSDYVKVLSDLLIAELTVQKAGWVVNGEIKSFKKDEIGPFALSPKGIQFAFAPYAVGPYVEGAFFVTIPFKSIDHIIDQFILMITPGRYPVAG